MRIGQIAWLCNAKLLLSFRPASGFEWPALVVVTDNMYLIEIMI